MPFPFRKKTMETSACAHVGESRAKLTERDLKLAQ